jgi:hypothetical protein
MTISATGAAYGNGTSSSWTPDPLARLATLAYNLAGNASDLTRTFTYNFLTRRWCNPRHRYG